MYRVLSHWLRYNITLFPPGPKYQRTQDLLQGSPAKQETAAGTASRQNTTKHGKRARGA